MDKIIVDNFKNRINEIETPKEADDIIKRAMERGEKKRNVRYLKPLTTAAAVLLICIVCAANSKALASYLEKVPVIKTIFGLENKGVENAIKNDFVQKPNKDLPACGQEAISKDITVTIDGLMISGNKLNLAYTLKAGESQKDLKDLKITKFDIIDNKNRTLWKQYEPFKAKDTTSNYTKTEFSGCSSATYDGENFEKNRTVKGFYDFMAEESKIDIPENITIKVSQLCESYLVDCNNKTSQFYKKFNRLPQVIDGEWTISIKLDKKFLEAEGVIYKPAEEIKDDFFKFEYVNVYPTTANAKFTLYDGFDIEDFGENVYLENEKGDKYTQNELGTYSDDKKNEYKFNLESPYYDRSGKLYLVINNIDGGMFKKNKSYRIELVKVEK